MTPLSRTGDGDVLTPKQRMVLDYMRGNGCELHTDGWRHLVQRGSFTNRGLSAVLRVLKEKRLVVSTPPPGPYHVLTKAGRRA